MFIANIKPKLIMSATITRADGSIEKLGVIASSEDNDISIIDKAKVFIKKVINKIIK